MPLTFKEAKDKLFGEDYIVRPGSSEYIQIRKYIEEREKPKPKLAPKKLEWRDFSNGNPLHVPPKPPAPVPTKRDMFLHDEGFKKHYITYLDRISVGNARTRPRTTTTENTNKKSEVVVEADATQTAKS